MFDVKTLKCQLRVCVICCFKTKRTSNRGLTKRWRLYQLRDCVFLPLKAFYNSKGGGEKQSPWCWQCIITGCSREAKELPIRLKSSTGISSLRNRQSLNENKLMFCPFIIKLMDSHSWRYHLKRYRFHFEPLPRISSRYMTTIIFVTLLLWQHDKGNDAMDLKNEYWPIANASISGRDFQRVLVYVLSWNWRIEATHLDLTVQSG